MRVDGVGCIGYMCYSLHQSAVFQWFSCNGQQLRAVLPDATVTCAFKVCKVLVSSEIESA